MPYETLRYDVADAVATIALDQPDTRNALSDALLDELLAALAAARDDDAVRVVVLASTHPTVFSSGGDLTGFAAAMSPAERHAANGRFPRLFTLIGELGKPVICAAGGHVLAGALGLVLACDLVIAGERATFGTPEINVGLFPFMIAALIARNVGRKKMTELLLLGERIDAAEALRVGIVNRVEAPEVRRGGRRMGGQARGEVAVAAQARQGRAVRTAGHGAARRAGARAGAARARATHRTPTRASPRSSSAGSRSGKAA